MGSFITAEQQLVIFLNSIAQSSILLSGVIIFFASIAIFIFVFFGVSALFINWPFIKISGKLFFIELLLAGATAWIINQVFSLVYFRKRPFISLSEITPLINKDVWSKSFPSDHSALAMAMAMVIFLWSPKVGIWFIFLALAIALARVFSGVHYPSDALIGLILGGVIGWFIYRLFI